MRKEMTPEFRVSFANVFAPRSFMGNEPKYSVVMLFDKSTDLSKLKALAKEAVEEKWPDASKRPSNLRSPFRDGDQEKPDREEYKNTIFINASSKMKIGVVDQNRIPIIDAEGFYSGCYARATVVAFAYDTAGNRGVSFGLQNIQKLRDGEQFSGRTKAEDDFDVVPGAAAPVSSVTDTGDMFG